MAPLTQTTSPQGLLLQVAQKTSPKINYAFVKTLGRGVLQYAPTSFLEMPKGLLQFQSALKRSADISLPQGWGRLLGTRQEAETILKLVSAGDRLEVFDFDANYIWATSSALNQFRILHFATHGFVNDANPELSGIVLSLVASDAIENVASGEMA